jgi:hypothetical protein
VSAAPPRRWPLPAALLALALAGRAEAAPPARSAALPKASAPPPVASAPPPVPVPAPAPAPAAPPASAVKAAPASWPLRATHVSLAITPPAGAHELEAERLPEVDLSSTPNGALVLNKGLVWKAPEGEGRLVAVCLTIDGKVWSDGIEGIFFDRLNSVAKAELEKRGELERYDARSSGGDGGQFLQRYSASLKEGSPAAARGRPRQLEPSAARANVLRAEGVHAIVFAGPRPDILACSVACVEADAASPPRCSPVLESLRLEGPLVAPPHPTAFARALGTVGRRPLAAVGFTVGGLLMLVGLALAVWGGQKRSVQGQPIS